MVGISVDRAIKTRALIVKHKIGFPLLEDDGLAVARKYRVADESNGIALPAVFVVSKSGAITWKYIGESVPDRPPSADILAALAALPGASN